MKHLIIFSILFSIFNPHLLHSQLTKINNSDVAGIYLTIDDFKSNQLFCSNDEQHNKTKVKLNQFFISPEISCTSINEKETLYKDSIFGIQLIDGESYRFIYRTPCLIADTSYLYIYLYELIEKKYHQTGPTSRLVEIPVTHYFFSTGNHKNIYPLTVDNVCLYSDINLNIKDAFRKKYTSNEMLQEVNPNTKHFLINEFLIDQTKKN